MAEQEQPSIEGNQINIEGEVHAPVVGGDVDQIGDRSIDTGGGDYVEQNDSGNNNVGQIGSRTINTGGGKYIEKVVNIFVSIPLFIRYAILVTTVLITIIFGSLVYPNVEPLWNQWDMPGDFNIAVADFGILDTDGRFQSNDFASKISKSIATQMEESYKAVKDEGDFPLNVVVWHDGKGRADGKNVRFGIFDGATPEERVLQAQKLVDDIDAHMVIYGYMTEETDPESLELEFYYQGQVRAGEPNALWGGYKLGTSVSGAVSYRDDEEIAQRTLVQRISPQIGALFRISQALAELLADNPDEALRIMHNAEQALDDTWLETDGKEVLYLFLGTAAFYAENFDTAIDALEEARRINPAYVPALDLLGSTYIQRAAFSQFRNWELTSEQQACFSAEAIANSDPDRKTALQSAATAVSLLREAEELSHAWHWPPYIYRVHMNLGYAYQLQGWWEVSEDFAEAEETLADAEREFQAALEGFPPNEQAIYHARTQIGMAFVDNIGAYMSLRRRDTATDVGAGMDAKLYASNAASQLEATIAHYQSCIDMGLEGQAAGSLFYQHSILDCVCIPNQNDAKEQLAKLQETNE